jgi:protocatechuate 3,4-dioxygenase beta subunit
MRSALASLVLCFACHAGVVRGIVYEHVSGLPLARTVIQLQPVPRPGVENKTLSMRASSGGTFAFLDVPDGLYFLIATRDPYFPAYYGQRRPDGYGKPIPVNKDTDLFAELRMYRKGAITGRVLDENGIGMQNVPVIAYPAHLPLRAAARGVSDDRGVYRVYGLEPGKYWVRSVEQTLEDGSGRLPTFGREGLQISESVNHIAVLDEDTPDADVRPVPGRLFRLRGRLLCEGGRVTVVLSSETGRKTTEAGCRGFYTFESLAPGSYEVFAQLQAAPYEAGFTELQLDHGVENGDVPLGPLPRVNFIVQRAGASGFADIPIKIFGHRQDLSENAEDRPILLRGELPPGHWEFTATVPAGMYVVSMTSYRRSRLPPDSSDDFDVLIEPRAFSQIFVTVSDQAVKMDGIVKDKDGSAVAGAPVYLWPVNDATRRSLHGYRSTIADVDGNFSFDSLPPGDYRLLATFDLTSIDPDKLEEAHAISVHVDAGGKPSADLVLWVAP